jgi:hypothetical protein
MLYPCLHVLLYIVLGIMSMVGYLFGGFLMYHMEGIGIVGCYMILIVVHAGAMVRFTSYRMIS